MCLMNNTSLADIFQHYVYYILHYYDIPDEDSLLPKYGSCAAPNGFMLCVMCCGVMLLMICMYMHIHIYRYSSFNHDVPFQQPHR